MPGGSNEPAYANCRIVALCAVWQRNFRYGILYSGGVIVIILFFGLLIFSKVERTFMDTV